MTHFARGPSHPAETTSCLSTSLCRAVECTDQGRSRPIVPDTHSHVAISALLHPSRKVPSAFLE